MVDAENPSYGKPIPGAPIQGTPEAEKFVASLVRAVNKANAKLEREMVSREKLDDFCKRKSFDGLLRNIRKENGDPLQFMKPAETPKPKARKKRMRVAI